VARWFSTPGPLRAPPRNVPSGDPSEMSHRAINVRGVLTGGLWWPIGEPASVSVSGRIVRSDADCFPSGEPFPDLRTALLELWSSKSHAWRRQEVRRAPVRGRFGERAGLRMTCSPPSHSRTSSLSAARGRLAMCRNSNTERVSSQDHPAFTRGRLLGRERLSGADPAQIDTHPPSQNHLRIR
jgi:hypothetical protein